MFALEKLTLCITEKKYWCEFYQRLLERKRKIENTEAIGYESVPSKSVGCVVACSYFHKGLNLL